MKSDIHKADRTAEAVGFPEVVLIDNCNACNLKCSMCDHVNMKKYRKVQLMPYDLYQKIVDEIANENPGARVWEIFFGDPFLCHDMAKRIGYAKEQGLQDVVLNSNGLRMTPQRAEDVIKAGLDAMYVGIDAYRPETYRSIRVGGDYGRAVRNVLAYRDLLKQHGNGKQSLFVQFVVSDLNQDEVEDFKAFWQQEGVKVKIRPKVSWAGLVEATNLHRNDQVVRKPCYWLMKTMNICADGSVALCSVDVHCRVACGNASNHSLKDIWQGQLHDYRQMHLQGLFDRLPSLCRDCSDWQSAYADFVT